MNYYLLFESAEKKDGSSYASSTLSSYLSILNDIYNYAQDRGDACNDLAYLTNREFTLLYTHPESATKAAHKLLSNKHNRLRSLTESQQSSLVRWIHDNITTDGRYLGLAILLYTGVRPSECRGLLWGDLIPFEQHPQRHMLTVSRSGDQKGKPDDHLKTHNSYRKIGIHIELQQLINLRYNYLIDHGYSDDTIKKLPLCCFMNNFASGCSHYQLSTFVTSLLREQLHVANYVLEICALEMFVREEPSEESKSEDFHVCTYLLRHNFWTWLQAATPLTAEEKCYYMGHDMRNDTDRNMRTRFNFEDKLWEMLLKLDHDIKHLGLHASALRIYIQFDSLTHTISNQGYQLFSVSPELLRTGGTLTLQITTSESDDPILITPHSPSKSIYPRENPLKFDAEILPYSHGGMLSTPINCDYANILVRKHLRVLSPDTTDTDTSSYSFDDSSDDFDDTLLYDIESADTAE